MRCPVLILLLLNGGLSGSFLPASLSPIIVQLQEPVPCQPFNTMVRLWCGGAGTVCWCTSGTQMHSFKEKQTQTEMTDCQLLGAYRTSHIPTKQGVFCSCLSFARKHSPCHQTAPMPSPGILFCDNQINPRTRKKQLCCTWQACRKRNSLRPMLHQ